MPIPVPSITEVSSKWQRRASAASQDLLIGINRAASRWQSATEAAASRWFDGVNQANGRDAFASGVRRAGNEKWLRKSRALAGQRYGSGVTAGAPDYTAAFGPFLQVIAALDLPERGVRGSEGNFERSARVGRALNAARLGTAT